MNEGGIRTDSGKTPMCHETCMEFGRRTLLRQEIAGRKVIEVGARDVNGSVRQFVEACGPSQYVGVDIIPGKGVDCLCRVENLVRKFGRETFDVVIATELLEHVRNWRVAVDNLKGVCAEGGVILVTTRSRGFPYHGFPFDFWRYEKEDMREIFGDCVIEALENDPCKPGVFLKARKRADARTDTPRLRLYCVLRGRRTDRVTMGDFLRPSVAGRLCVLLYWQRLSPRLPAFFRSALRRCRQLLGPRVGRLFSKEEDV